jgi:hypothetical protein
MRFTDEIWSIPPEEREEALDTFTPAEMRQLARGYAVTAEAVADYLGAECVLIVEEEE